MKDKVTLAEILEQLSDETYISKTAAQEFISHLTDIIIDEIETKEKAAITNFGSFTVVDVAERKGVNPQTGEPIIIPAHKRISFTPYKALEKKVNHEYDHLEATVIDDNAKRESTEKDKPKSEPNSAEALFNTLTSSPGKQTSPDDDPFNFEEETDSIETDNFDFKTNTEFEKEEITSTPVESDDDVLDDILGLNKGTDQLNISDESEEKEDDTETLVLEETMETIDFELKEESVSEDNGENEELPKKSSSFRTPGLPNRRRGSMNPSILLTVIASIVVLMLAIWFIWIRPNSSPPEVVENEAATSEQSDPLNDPQAFEPPSNTESSQSNEAEDTESQVIPMVAEDVDLSENPGEMRSFDNPEPQIEMQETITATYTTGNGVWIYEIARQTYGNTRLWPLIFQANYTIANDPDLILPNVNLNIPKLDGSTDNPSSEDYRRLADAARYVSQAYEQAGNDSQATAYRKAADWYESMR